MVRQQQPTERESEIARSSKQLLSRYIQADQPLMIRVIDAEHDAPVELPAGAVVMLMDILDAMAAGQGMTLFQKMLNSPPCRRLTFSMSLVRSW